MTVGELIEALERYDRDRDVLTADIMASRIACVRSIEPDGPILLLEERGYGIGIHSLYDYADRQAP